MLPNGRASFTSELALFWDSTGARMLSSNTRAGQKVYGRDSGVASCAATHPVARARTTHNALPLRRRYVKRSFVGRR